jgi:hypothetical protein
MQGHEKKWISGPGFRVQVQDRLLPTLIYLDSDLLYMVLSMMKNQKDLKDDD